MRLFKNRMPIFAFTFLCAASIVFIFSNSIPSIPESREASEQILEIVKPILGELIGEENVTNHLIRKSAHVVEFFCLGILLSALLLLAKRNVFWGCHIGLLTALIDETIQLFSQRGAQLQDVWLDYGSVLAAVIIAWKVNRIYNHYTKKKSEEK